MPPIAPSDDYAHGQMMGMLVIIQMFENVTHMGAGLSIDTLEKIKDIAVKDLSTYLGKPEEDVLLLVNNQLKDVL